MLGQHPDQVPALPRAHAHRAQRPGRRPVQRRGDPRLHRDQPLRQRRAGHVVRRRARPPSPARPHRARLARLAGRVAGHPAPAAPRPSGGPAPRAPPAAAAPPGPAGSPACAGWPRWPGWPRRSGSPPGSRRAAPGPPRSAPGPLRCPGRGRRTARRSSSRSPSPPSPTRRCSPISPIDGLARARSSDRVNEVGAGLPQLVRLGHPDQLGPRLGRLPAWPRASTAAGSPGWRRPPPRCPRRRPRAPGAAPARSDRHLLGGLAARPRGRRIVSRRLGACFIVSSPAGAVAGPAAALPTACGRPPGTAAGRRRR